MKQLLIAQTDSDTTTAILENNKLTEIFIDNETTKVGQIIVGRVRTIMPGQFAFIDIGDKKNAFANFKDANNIKTGQPIVVQVQKDATASKGAYVTQDIELKGWLVILHRTPGVGVSHKITNEKESRRLKELVRKLLPKGYGAIVRTNAQEQDSGALKAEIDKLHKIFEEVLHRGQYALPPAKLYPTIPSGEILKDLISDSLDEVHISGSVEMYFALQMHICELVPKLDGKVFHFQESKLEDKLLDAFGVRRQMRIALEKTVPLPCGGFITIEETEACVVVDVNTGNNTNSQSYRQTILNTNLEAATEIINQIILRNLAGIIVIDFIDMSRQEDREAVMAKLTQEAKRDRLNPEITGMSKFGIVQMARPKRRLSLSQILETTCPHCSGKGKVRRG